MYGIPFRGTPHSDIVRVQLDLQSASLASGIHLFVGDLLQVAIRGPVVLENTGNIGKNYRKHDEIGTPACITVDFQTLEDNSVTVRDRDTMDQKRLKIEEVRDFLKLNYNI